MATPRFEKLFQPGVIGKMRVKNRTVMPPCTTMFAGATGEVNDRIIRYYEERAKGGVGLIIVENTQVKYPEGKNVSCQLRLDDDKYIPGYGELAEAVHAYGTKIFQQVHHAGRQAHGTEGAQFVAPSPVTCGYVQVPPRELTTEEIWDLVERYSETALRVKKAGMDGVELHGAHGYLIAQFMTPYTNKRVDEWGGSFERRMKFPREIIKRTREKVGPDFPLCFRFNGCDFVPGARTLEDAKEIAPALEEAGVDVLHVTAAIYESMNVNIEPMRFEEGWRVYLAEEIKKMVNIPVITVGQIKSPEFAERILEEGRADFVAMGRALIADPEWPNKAADGRDKEIRKCISCDIGCTGNVFNELFLKCTVNPAAGRERMDGWVELKPAQKKKKVMVIGGGPAGLEAARVGSLRGHDVTLMEKEKELYGQLKIACVPPYKDKLNYVKEYYSSQLQKNGAKVELGKQTDEPSIRGAKPDVVILATGAEPLLPDIPGITGKSVLHSWDVLSGKAKVPGKKVVVVGGASVGCETALYLAREGKDVTIVEMLEELALDMALIPRWDLLKEQLPEAGVAWITGKPVIEISDNGVFVLEPTGRRSLIKADSVVLALGAKSVNTLEEKVRKLVPEVHVIGDSKQPRKLIDAIYEGALLARMI